MMHQFPRPVADTGCPPEADDDAASDSTSALDLDLTMPPLEDDILDQDSRIYTPPPRVAARFYRPSQARRRDSAASSRRNSISSAHSRCSSLQHRPSGRGDGEQSKYVAQHLRRASFLEDRRARLADRAAHAEKVRLRAALAKATPRGPTTSEERALAAQQARERNLAEIVATCAEEVRKAKQVAELTKERREQEMVTMRAQIEERMADAERRREELRSKNATRRSRGQSVVARKAHDVLLLPQVKEETNKPSMAEDVAVALIQSWWRRCARYRTIRDFNRLGLSVDGISDSSFESVIELLGTEEILAVTARLLRICGLREGEPGSVDELAAVRTFLSAFLILGHPEQVLSSKNDDGAAPEQEESPVMRRLPNSGLANPQVQDLVGKAKDLLVCFENILARLTLSNRFTMPPTLQNVLPEAYAVYYNAFIAWKSRDSDALIEVMLMQFVELDAIFQTIKDTTDDAAAALYRQSIKENQLMLIVRIKKLAGAERGKKMIFKAVSEARKARKSRTQTGDTKPRVAEDSVGADDAAATASGLVSAEPPTLTPPTSPSRPGEGRPTFAKTGLSELLPDNRIIVHELAINKEYQIPCREYVEQEYNYLRPLYINMRYAVAENDTESNFRLFMLMFVNIRDKLRRPLDQRNSMYNLIGDILDPEMAERQWAVGSFSYEKFFEAIGKLLPKLCAPCRDDQVKDVQILLADGHHIDRLVALMGFIDLMLCDYINHLLRVSGPSLIDSAAEYEAKVFAAEIAEGKLGLDVAEAAWRAATAKVVGEAQKRDCEGIDHPKLRPTATQCYAQLLVDVFTQPTPIKVDQIPEMLRLDHRHVDEVSTMARRVITAGAVLLQCKNLMKRDVRSPWKTEANRIMAVLEANHASLDATVQGTMAALEAGRSMPAVTKTQLRALVTKVLKASLEMSQQSVEPREPVLRLLLARLRGNILARLAPGSASEKVKAANKAGERLASLGLSEFVERVRGLSDLLEKIGNADRRAHGQWWDVVSAKVQQEQT